MDLQSPPKVLLELLFSPNGQKSSSLCNTAKATLLSIGQPASLLYLSVLEKHVSFRCCGHDCSKLILWITNTTHGHTHSHADTHFCFQLYVYEPQSGPCTFPFNCTSTFTFSLPVSSALGNSPFSRPHPHHFLCPEPLSHPLNQPNANAYKT